MSKPFLDLHGQRFGYWEAMRKKRQGTVTFWLCRCVCGAKRYVRMGDLRNGMSTNCGCLRNRKHGHAARDGTSPTYSGWRAMLQRCHNPKHPKYKFYGGRGIRVCKRWHTFANFLADMGERPADKTIDRINNYKGYSRSNCRWATRQEQDGNTRRRQNVNAL